MGRMEDALKKAAEERERRRAEASEGGVAPAAVRAEAAEAVAGPRTAARAAAGSPALSRAAARIDERLIVVREPHGAEAEQFRKVRANLSALKPTPRTILVTSGAHGEGKSLFAANLAAAFLETRQGDVLVVDANLRRPEMAGLLAARPGPGLSELLTGAEADLAALIQSTEVPGLYFLPAGSVGDAAAQVLAPEVLRRALGRIPARFPFVIVDGAAAVEFADVPLMAPDVDGVVLVVKVETGKRSASKKAVELIDQAGARLLGTVVWAGA